LEEQDDVRAQIHQSGARILLVGLGCPKQEWWMSEQVGHLQAVMVGVGAAFDFHAGRVPQAPSYLQEAGLEWLFRLTKEPKRLWKRYLKHNPRFVALMGAQIAGLDHFFSPGSASKTE
jgi:N-acetylglucosaminyldiphosphoundecaprenol N-acetyl-beta-D-mannosaminyltransferase